MFCFQLDVADNGMGLLTGQKLAALEFPRGFTVRWCPVLSNCSHLMISRAKIQLLPIRWKSMATHSPLTT
jgi:hypothetical protein